MEEYESEEEEFTDDQLQLLIALLDQESGPTEEQVLGDGQVTEIIQPGKIEQGGQPLESGQIEIAQPVESQPFDTQLPELGQPVQNDPIPQMDPEEYLKFVKNLLEEQGIDFNEWQQAMLQQSIASSEAGTGTEIDAGWWSPEDEEEEQSDTNEETTPSGTTEPVEKEQSETEQIEYGPLDSEPPPKSLMGMKSFRYLESRILANFLQDTEDERINKIRARLGYMKKVEPPGISASVDVLKPPMSKSVMVVESGTEMEQIEAEHVKEFTAREWALKNAMSFLHKEGCRSLSQSEADMKVPDRERSPRLKIFLQKGGLGERRREGVGEKGATPEINSPLKRIAERSIWRNIVNNSKPKYPLPRFILPRHKLLRKIESELIGPGSYEHDYYERQWLKRLHSMPSQFRSCSQRFPKEKWRCPAANFISDPYVTWDEACDHKRHPGTVPLFQSTPCNFRYKDFYVGCGLPPGHYNIKSPVDEMLKETKSLRNLYDQGSGSDAFREFSKVKEPKSRLGPGYYNVTHSVVKLFKDRNHYFKGKFSKTNKSKMCGFKAAFDKPLWPQNTGFPGPATYNPYESERWIEQNWAPFGVLAKTKTMDLNIVSKLVAPDYYYYGDGYTSEKGWKPEIFGDGFKSNFESKTPMTTPESFHIVLKERNKPVNHQLDQELFFPSVAKKEDPCSTDPKCKC